MRDDSSDAARRGDTYDITQCDIEHAAETIRSGGIVAFPTETVYGLGANALDSDAVAKIFAAKGRPADNPLIVHIASFNEIYNIVSEVPETARLLADNFWPGPLTLVLKRSSRIPDIVSAGLDTVAVRMPNHPAALELIRKSGVPIAAPSANRSGSPSPTTAEHVRRDLGNTVEVLDAGVCEVGVESTVLSLVSEPPRLLRPGGVTLEQLRAALGGDVAVDDAVTRIVDEAHSVSSPGMKYRHYAPSVPLRVVVGPPQRTAAWIVSQLDCDPNAVAMLFDEYAHAAAAVRRGKAAHVAAAASGDTPVGKAGTPDASGGIPHAAPRIIPFGAERDTAQQARLLFDALRRADVPGASIIYAQCPEEQGIGLAVANRLKKAAGYDIIELGL